MIDLTPTEARSHLATLVTDAHDPPSAGGGYDSEDIVDTLLSHVPLLLLAIGSVTARLGIKLGSEEWESSVDLGGGVGLATQRGMLIIELKDVS